MLDRIKLLIAAASLLMCVLIPVFYFQGSISRPVFRNSLAVVSIVYFVFATAWAGRKKAGNP